MDNQRTQRETRIEFMINLVKGNIVSCKENRRKINICFLSIRSKRCFLDNFQNNILTKGNHLKFL